MYFRMLAAAALAAGAILGVAGGAAASNGNSWTDPARDSANAADLTGVTAQSDDSGKITFTMTYGNRPAGLTDDDQVQIWLNSDDNQATGDSGFDYVLGVEKGRALLVRRTPTGFEDTPSTTVTGSADGRTVSVNRSELGNTAKFEFFVRDLVRTDASVDEAPDAADRVFVYYVVGPRPQRILSVFSPKAPRAGKAFTAVVPLVTLEDGSAAVGDLSLACKATLNGKPLVASVKPLRCVWKLPKSAKGKQLVISIAVTNNGATATFGPWRFRVR